MPRKKKEKLSEESTPITKQAHESHEHVLYVEPDEEVTSVIDRMKHATGAELYVVIPSRALLFQSVVNLKLIKKEAATLEKQVNIVTTDRKGMNLASQVGLTVYQDLKSHLKQPTVKEEPPAGHHAAAAHTGHAAVATGTQAATSKQSALHRGMASMKEKLKKTNKSPDGKQAMDVAAFVSSSPNRRVLTLFIGVSLLLLVVIAYFVLPQATIHIQPNEQVEKPLERIVLADADLNAALLKVNNDNTIASFPIETEIELTKSYSATGVTSTGSDALGQVIIFNDSAATQPLIRTTRLRSPDGLIFRIQNDVIVPPRSTATVTVIADKLDEAGQVIGERGNLGPTKFILPGLKGSNREQVYAKNTEPFSGGKTDVASIVQKQDLEAAKTSIVEELKSVAKQKLRDRLMNENKTRDAQLALLDSDKALQVNVVEVKVVDDVQEGALMKEFQVYGKIKVFGVTYDRREAIKILDQKLRTFIHPDQVVGGVDYDSLKLEFVAFDENKKTKVNASMSYRLQYEISEDMKTQIKEHVMGKSIAEAELYVQTLSEVGDVKVETWPFWVQSIPGVAWNIKIVTDDSIT